MIVLCVAYVLTYFTRAHLFIIFMQREIRKVADVLIKCIGCKRSAVHHYIVCTYKSTKSLEIM